jgi:predicted glycosyltransferase
MRWWVDIANAPHATLFRPVVRRLREEGDEVLVTVWDRGQTLPLALGAWPEARVVGVPGFRGALRAKATAIWDRASALASEIAGTGVEVALGHNSYSQLVAARRRRLPSITMMDYEHQPANHLAFRLADVVVTPAAVGHDALKRYGVRPCDLVHYDGFKEEIALAEFRPDPTFRASIGVGSGERVAVVRPAAEGALYHRRRNTLCDDVIDRLARAGCTVILTPRTADQAGRYAGRAGVTVLRTPVSGADLLFSADAVVGAGGTMTREAAVLGVPTWSIFEGRPAAVDRALHDLGRLRFLRAAEDLPLSEITGAPPPRPAWEPPVHALSSVVRMLREQANRLVG